MNPLSRAAVKLFGYRGVAGSITFIFPLACAIGLIGSVERGISTGNLIVAIVICLGICRFSLMCIRVHDDHITVTNLLRTHRIPWTGIEGFSAGSILSQPVVVVDLKDGASVKAGGTYSGNGDMNNAGRVRKIVGRLNDELPRHQG